MKFKNTLLLPLSSLTHATECLEGIERSNPDSRFDVVDTQFALDKATNLMWTRCKIGSEVNQYDNCEELTLDKMNLMDATRFANNSELGGFSNWRLPNIKELQSLVDTTCEDEYVNETIFSNLAVTSVWSSTTYPRRESFAMTMYLPLGSAGQVLKTHELYFYLVRNTD